MGRCGFFDDFYTETFIEALKLMRQRLFFFVSVRRIACGSRSASRNWKNVVKIAFGSVMAKCKLVLIAKVRWVDSRFNNRRTLFQYEA